MTYSNLCVITAHDMISCVMFILPLVSRAALVTSVENPVRDEAAQFNFSQTAEERLCFWFLGTGIAFVLAKVANRSTGEKETKLGRPMLFWGWGGGSGPTSSYLCTNMSTRRKSEHVTLHHMIHHRKSPRERESNTEIMPYASGSHLCRDGATLLARAIVNDAVDGRVETNEPSRREAVDRLARAAGATTKA